MARTRAEKAATGYVSPAVESAVRGYLMAHRSASADEVVGALSERFPSAGAMLAESAGFWTAERRSVSCYFCHGLAAEGHRDWCRLAVTPAAVAVMDRPKCVECGRVFDLTDGGDAAEWAYGHDCEAL